MNAPFLASAYLLTLSLLFLIIRTAYTAELPSARDLQILLALLISATWTYPLVRDR